MVTPRRGSVRARLDAISTPRVYGGEDDRRMYRRVRLFVLQRDRYRCWLCGHVGVPGPASGFGVDHVIPRSECQVRGISWLDSSNMRAVHDKQPCPQCTAAAEALGNSWSGYCNAIRGSGSPERFRTKLLAATGIELPGAVAAAGTDRPGRRVPRDASGTSDQGERSWD